MLPEEGLTAGVFPHGERAARTPPVSLRGLLLDALYILAAILYLPVLAYQMIALGKNRRGWGQRLGAAPWRIGSKPCIWVHAVSLGEVNATRALVSALRAALPECVIAVSATTDTGYAAACRLYPDLHVFRFPLDFSFAVRRALARIRPAAIVLMELEVWPNLIRAAATLNVPVVVANGRITAEKSMRRFRLPVVRGAARRMFGRLAFAAVQNDVYARRFIELGVPPDRVHVVGSMKYDTAAIADGVPGDGELARAVGIDRSRPLIVAGSTGPDEEAILLDAFSQLRAARPGLQLAIIPRKPERFDEVARLIESRGLTCVRRSRHPDKLPAAAPSPGAALSPGDAAPRVVLGDTMGELRKFYALAGAVFVGRSLAPLGGSDLMEVAGLARPMCFGPHVENFADVAEQLLAVCGAVQVAASAGEPGAATRLAEALARLLDHSEEGREMGRRAQEVVRKNTGATQRTVELIVAAMGKNAGAPGCASR